MQAWLESIDPNLRSAFDTLAGPLAGVLIAVALYAIASKLLKKRATEDDTPPEHDDAPAKPPILGPLCAWFGVALAFVLADYLIQPRAASVDHLYPTDALLRTPHAFLAGAAGALLAFGASRVLPAWLTTVWRALLGAGVGVLAVWLIGDFLLKKEIWTAQRFWWAAGVFGAVNAALWALVGAPTERTHAPALSALASAALLAGAGGPLFLSGSTRMAHTLAAFGVALALLGLLAFRWRALAASSILPTLALGALAPAVAITSIYQEKPMLIAALVPLALAPLAIVVHRLPLCTKLPGHAWCLPALVTLLALAATLGTSAAFATGLLEIHPDKAPWSDAEPESEADDGGYDDYDFYNQ